MKISDILIGNLRQELTKVRDEYKKLKRIGPSPPPPEAKVDHNLIKQMQQKVNDGSLPVDEYRAWATQLFAPHDARMNKWSKESKNYGIRISYLIRRADEIRGQLRYLKSIGTPSGIFANKEQDPYLRQNEHYFDPIGRVIDNANENLPYEASHLIAGFVGHSNRASEENIGVWDAKNMEDAFSNHPQKPENVLARQQLEQAMQPIKELLRQRFGDTIPLHRAQQRLIGNETPRRALSWTASPHFAKFIAGDQRDVLSIAMPVDKIIWITNRANQQEFICQV